MKKSDALLVTELQSGDKKALETLVKRWHKIFCKKAYWIVRDVELSKDIAQEVWQIIIYKIDTLKDVHVFKYWAFRIIYTKSFDALRLQNKKRFKESQMDISEIPITEDYKENKVLSDVLLEAVKGLPGQQQVVLRLFYTEEYSLKEISNLLKISIGTTKSRLFHAREKLKKVLEDKRDDYQ